MIEERAIAGRSGEEGKESDRRRDYGPGLLCHRRGNI